MVLVVRPPSPPAMYQHPLYCPLLQCGCRTQLTPCWRPVRWETTYGAVHYLPASESQLMKALWTSASAGVGGFDYLA